MIGRYLETFGEGNIPIHPVIFTHIPTTQVIFVREVVFIFLLVDPKRVPQMADGAEVLAGISRNPAISYAALTPNMRGLERAIAAGVDEIAVFGSASEGFSQANINCSISESFSPALSSALGIAFTGPIPMILGSTPATA